MKRILLFYLILVVNISFAQRTVTGLITEKSGKPLEGVKVSVKNTDFSTFTNSSGKYSINVPDGKNSLEFSKEDFKVQVVEITGNEVNVTMTLLTDANLFELSLDELMNMKIVTASKYEEQLSQTPATVLVITKNDIENRGYTSLYEIFSDIPGFDIAAAFSNETQLNYARGNRTGSYNERTMFMIDGIESNILYCQLMNTSSDFPLTSIKRIEVVYGPASAIYGPNVFSGIINVITESAEGLDDESSKVFVHSGLGSDNTKFAEMTYLTKLKSIELSVSYRRFQSDMFDITNRAGFFAEGKIIGNPNIWGPYASYYSEYNNRVDNNALLIKTKIKNFEFGYNHLLTKNGTGSEYAYDKALCMSDWKFVRDIAYVRANKDITDKFSITFLGTYQNCGVPSDAVFGDGWNDGNTWNSQRTVEMLTWKYMSEKWSIYQDFEYHPYENWIINGGVKFSSGRYQKSYENGSSDQTIWMPGSQWPTVSKLFAQPVPVGFSPGNNFNEDEWGTFFQSKLLLSDKKVSLIAGLRYDKNSNYGEIYSPRVGATYSVTENLTFKTSYGTGFQTPAPRNLYGSWGGLAVNDNLKPDKIQAIDFSISTKVTNTGIDATLFHNQITNSIMQGENLPTKNILGIECKLNYIFPSVGNSFKNASIHFNYSYLNAKYTSTRTNDKTGRSSDKIGDIAPNKFNIILNMDIFKHFHLNIRMNYVDKRETEISNPIQSVDAYFVTNLNFQIINLYENKLKLFFNINNVFDKDYYHPGMDAADAGEDISKPSSGWYSSRLPQPKRNFTIGMYLNL